MDLSHLPQDKAANLIHLAETGDIMAEALVNCPVATLVDGGAPAAASATAVHANVFGDAVGPVTVTAGLSNPDVARNVTATFGATWDGGAVVVSGVDQFGNHISESLAANPGGATTGAKCFKTVTSFTYAGGGVGTHGTNVTSVGTGTKIGVTKKPATGSPVLLTTDGVGEAVTFNTTNNTFAPTTAPNGSHKYVLNVNL